jgi:hypothetical protein
MQKKIMPQKMVIMDHFEISSNSGNILIEKTDLIKLKEGRTEKKS